jgi:hypothetical protein
MPMRNQGRKKITGHKGLNPVSANSMTSSCSMFTS